MKIYDKSLFATAGERREFEQTLYEVSKNIAAKTYKRHSITPGWIFDDFLSEAHEVALKYSQKAQQIFLIQGKKPCEAYLAKCILFKLNNFAEKEHVYRKHMVSLESQIGYGENNNFVSNNTIGYSFIETQFKNQTPWAMERLIQVSTKSEFETMHAHYWENKTANEIKEEQKISLSTVYDRKKSVIEKIVLATSS